MPYSQLVKIQEKQERVFDSMVRLNGLEKFDYLELEVPYIVGSITNFKFEKMQNFGDYMLSIDPDASQVKASSKKKLKSGDKHAIYCESWQKVLKHSSMVNSVDKRVSK